MKAEWNRVVAYDFQLKPIINIWVNGGCHPISYLLSLCYKFTIFIMEIDNYCYEARKNGVVSLLLEKHMHAVVYGLISCLIRHSKEGSLIYWSVFQVSHFGSSLQAGQCMQQQHLLKAATIYVTSADDKDILLLCFCCCCRICRNAMADDMTQNVKICGTFFSTRIFVMK